MKIEATSTHFDVVSLADPAVVGGAEAYAESMDVKDLVIEGEATVYRCRPLSRSANDEIMVEIISTPDRSSAHKANLMALRAFERCCSSSSRAGQPIKRDEVEIQHKLAVGHMILRASSANPR